MYVEPNLALCIFHLLVCILALHCNDVMQSVQALIAPMALVRAALDETGSTVLIYNFVDIGVGL